MTPKEYEELISDSKKPLHVGIHEAILELLKNYKDERMDLVQLNQALDAMIKRNIIKDFYFMRLNEFRQRLNVIDRQNINYQYWINTINDT